MKRIINFMGVIIIFVILQASTISSINISTGFETTNENTEDVQQINITFESNNYNLYGELYYPTNASGKYPGIVFCEGFAGYTSAYNWIPMALAEKGYVVLIFDFPGQGKSEGFLGNRSISIPFLNLYIRFSAFIETRIHGFFNHMSKSISDALTYLVEESPVKNLVDETKLGLIGHSMGGMVVTETAAIDKRVKSVVALSHADFNYVEEIKIPIQFQMGIADLQTYSIPVSLISYMDANTPKELISIQLGTHFGFTTAFGRFCPCPNWQKEICLKYAAGWFDYFLKNKQDALEIITTGTDHLSKLIRSRYNFGDGNHFLN